MGGVRADVRGGAPAGEAAALLRVALPDTRAHGAQKPADELPLEVRMTDVKKDEKPGVVTPARAKLAAIAFGGVLAIAVLLWVLMRVGDQAEPEALPAPAPTASPMVS